MLTIDQLQRGVFRAGTLIVILAAVIFLTLAGSDRLGGQAPHSKSNEKNGEGLLRAEGKPSASLQFGTAVVVILSPEVALQEKMRQVLNSDETDLALQLAIVGIKVPANSASGVRIFINKADVDSKTSIKDDHYAGSIVLAADSSPLTAYLDATSTLRKLSKSNRLDVHQPLKVTLLLIPLDAVQPMDKLAIPFEKVTLSVEK